MEKIIIKIIGTHLNTLSFFAPNYAAKKALYLFSKPRKGKLRPQHQSFLESAKQEVLVYKDYNIATYHWKGDKTTILLAHGWESNAARWKNIIKHLTKKGFNIIALDAPAHGDSSGKLFNAILYSECINALTKQYKPEIIIGHSVGGMASVLFQKNYPLESLSKFVLLGTPSEFKTILKDYVQLLGFNKKIERYLDKVIFEKFNVKPHEFSTALFAKEVDIKSLIIHDINDPIIPFSDAERIHQNLKNSTLISTEGLKHSLNDISVTKHILEFLEV